MNIALATWATPRLAAFEAALFHTFPHAEPATLREACLYPLQTGGKRVRPLLTLAACEAVGGDWRVAVPAAVAIELLHTYSLVHDDLPCMDDDDERRGRPTVHVKYGENVAVLVGDALLTEAFATLASAGYPPALATRLVGELARAGGAGGMIAGQAIDIGMDGPVGALDPLVRLHRLKTGALIRCAVRMGGLCGGAVDLDALDAYGDAVGLAFQVHDDVLDADQDADADGPPSFVKLLGVDATRATAQAHAERAGTALAGLAGADALRMLARFTVERSI
ncbi:MAG: polyprenyl synthetase family protein [Pseudomonadota bacterium]|nr:polyprenyl synthetase family protein [Pseudomonadota bacterium]